MPFYDYYCSHNQQTVEVFHRMTVRLKTWGEVCTAAGCPPGPTPPQAPVIRLIAGTPLVETCKGLDKDDYGTGLRQ